MRTLLLALSALVIDHSLIEAQVTPAAPATGPVLVDDVPEGANWIADAATRSYYRVGCPITTSIRDGDRLYYKSEVSLKAAGFAKSNKCHPGTAEMVRPVPDPPSDVALPVAALPVKSSTTEKHTRRGFWFNAGLGYGSLGCGECDGRTGAPSGGLALGGALSQKVMLGVGANGWTKSESGATLSVGTLAALIRFYPSPTGGFFLLGGVGLGTERVSASGLGSAAETGVGGILGLGYDIRVGTNLSLTPYWNAYGVNTTNSGGHVAQIGLGITVH